MLQRSGRVVGFIETCLPLSAKIPPSGSDWLHEIKHDGFRILAQRNGRTCGYTGNGNECLTKNYHVPFGRRAT
jgi:ATP-dependent DNA ligase